MKFAGVFKKLLIVLLVAFLLIVIYIDLNIKQPNSFISRYLTGISFENVVNKRQSIRSFKDKKVNDKTITRILNMVNRAPSAGNLQAYKIYVIRNQEIIDKLAKASFGQSVVLEAQQILVFVALKNVSAKKYGQRGRDLYSIQDATIAAAYSQLAIESLNLGSVWIGAFDPANVADILHLDSNQEPVAIIPFGVKDEKPPKSTRKNLRKLVTFLD